MLKPSGIIVYAVCSTEPEESEDVVNEFLKNHREFVIDNQLEAIPDEMRTVKTPDGWFKTFPDFSHMDGFSFVRLERLSKS